jgi:hypothetical protein
MDGKTFSVFLGLLVGVGAALTLALSIPKPPTTGTSYAEFRRHWTQWELVRPAGYTLRIERHCFCAIWDVRVEIFPNGEERLEHARVPEDPGRLVSQRWHPRNIEEVFAYIDNLYFEKAYRIDLKFDEKYGFPYEAGIDWALGVVDDESRLVLSDFIPALDSAATRQ